MDDDDDDPEHERVRPPNDTEHAQCGTGICCVKIRTSFYFRVTLRMKEVLQTSGKNSTLIFLMNFDSISLPH